jgi:hypothetical protein
MHERNINNIIIANNYLYYRSLQSVSPSTFLADPSTFRGVPTLTPSACLRSIPEGLICGYSTILGDNEQVPPQPNLDNSGGGNSVIGRFLVWSSSTDRSYMTFRFASAQSLTAINIEFLNYPTQGFSEPT